VFFRAASEHAERIGALFGNRLTNIPQLGDPAVLKAKDVHDGAAAVAGELAHVRMRDDEVAVADHAFDLDRLVWARASGFEHASLERLAVGGEVGVVMLKRWRDAAGIRLINAARRNQTQKCLGFGGVLNSCHASIVAGFGDARFGENGRMTTHDLTIFADYRQFYLLDANSSGSAEDSWTEQSTADYFAHGSTPDFIAVGTGRNTNVPVRVTVVDRAPALEYGAWERIMESSLHVPSGVLLVQGCTASRDDAPRVTVPAGWVRVRVRYAGLSTVSDNQLEGEDRYDIVVWPGAQEPQVQHKPARPEAGQTVDIRAHKADGRVYKWWRGVVREIGADGIVIDVPPGTVVSYDDSEPFAMRWHIVERFWFARRFNLQELYDPVSSELAELYCDIGSQPVLRGHALHFTDHELDVGQKRDQPPYLDDEDEFNAAIATYGYPEGLQSACWAAVEQARAAIAAVDWSKRLGRA
jgi:protein associated with RNAse G/E